MWGRFRSDIIKQDMVTSWVEEYFHKISDYRWGLDG